MPTTNFLVRVEPRDAPPDAAGWAALDEAMDRAGFRRWVTGADGITYLLPTGEYRLAKEYAPWDVLGRARRATVEAGVRCAIVVAETTAVVWMELDRVPVGEACD